MQISKGKKPACKCYILFDSNYDIVKRRDYRDSKNISGQNGERE